MFRMQYANDSSNLRMSIRPRYLRRLQIHIPLQSVQHGHWLSSKLYLGESNLYSFVYLQVNQFQNFFCNLNQIKTILDGTENVEHLAAGQYERTSQPAPTESICAPHPIAASTVTSPKCPSTLTSNTPTINSIPWQRIKDPSNKITRGT